LDRAADVNRILVPIDGSRYSARALEVAIDLARALDADLIVLHVVDLARVAMMSGGQAQLIPGSLEELQIEGRRVADEAVARAMPTVRASARIVQGAPVELILQIAAETSPRFIVIGTHGRTGFNRALMGSVAEGVARRAPVPVMIVPPERHPHKDLPD
jgi:nucleotide-binding universal stress UspA family protein